MDRAVGGSGAGDRRNAHARREEQLVGGIVMVELEALELFARDAVEECDRREDVAVRHTAPRAAPRPPPFTGAHPGPFDSI